MPALVSGVVVLAGLLLSFMVRRRRVFVRATPGEAGGSVVELGGLTRSDAAGGFEEEFSGLTAEISGLHQARPGSDDGASGSGVPDAAAPDPNKTGPDGAGPEPTAGE
jgi:cytochrome c biogenesis protein